MATVRHREVWVDLNNTDDHFVIVGRVVHAMRTASVGDDEVEEFRREAHQQETIDDLIAVCRKWVEVTRD